jgi:hypothetical protein
MEEAAATKTINTTYICSCMHIHAHADRQYIYKRCILTFDYKYFLHTNIHTYIHTCIHVTYIQQPVQVDTATPNPPQAASDAATQSKGLGENAHGHWRMSVQWEHRKAPLHNIFMSIYIYILCGCRQTTPLRVQRNILFRNTNSNTNLPIQITARASKA